MKLSNGGVCGRKQERQWFMRKFKGEEVPMLLRCCDLAPKELRIILSRGGVCSSMKKLQ